MSRACVAKYRIAGLAMCSFLLFGCGGGYGAGPGGPPLVGDASLSMLTVTGVTLSPAFSPSIFSYTANVPNSTDTVEVLPVTTSALATFTINGGTNTIRPLMVGNNTITVEVAGQYGTVASIYTIVITRATIVVNTAISWNGHENLAPFGKGSGGTEALEVFGQTFVVTANAPTLQRLSFWLQYSTNDTSGEDVVFSVMVMAWNTDRATGPVLYESALQSISSAQSTMTEYLVDTGGLPLVPGQYIAFLSANNGFWNATFTPIEVGFQNVDAYSQGEAWTLNTDNIVNFTQSPWNKPFDTADLAVIFSTRSRFRK